MKIIKRGEIMEHENKYASRGVAGAGLGLGIAGTALGLLNGNGNGLGGLFNVNGNCGCNEDHVVNRYEAAQSARIAELETEVKLRDSNIYTDGKILELYKYVDGKFGVVEAELCQQRVYNATNTSTLSCISGQVAALQALTKTVIPIGNVCPEPMPAYNSWTAPTAPATGA
jgi:hypothetical protein